MEMIPQRISLPDQVAEILRRGINAGRWGHALPSERALCREMQVSRVTLRKAIAQLTREKWLAASSPGSPCRVQHRSSARPAVGGRVVRVLTPFSLPVLESVHLVILHSLTERLACAGYRCEIEHQPRLFARHEPAKLRHLDAQPDTAAWVLLYSPAPMQGWFAASGRPCVVIGRVHEGVPLPCVFPDTQAAARHAAGLFYARGHRRFAYLIAEFTSLGDRLGSQTFAAEAALLGAHARVVTHAPEMPALRRALDSLLAAHPQPTAFFSHCAEHCLTTLCHLQNAGMRIPDQAAILAGWDDLSLAYTVPEISRYRIDGVKVGRQAATLLLDALKHGPGEFRAVRIVPEFVRGGTI
jgi:DNA-binding LacI/PurR family transcriptional regulator